MIPIEMYDMTSYKGSEAHRFLSFSRISSRKTGAIPELKELEDRAKAVKVEQS